MTTAGPRPMTPQDLLRIRWVSDPQISPDGARVAFVVTTLSEERDEYLSAVWVVDLAGGVPRRFTTGPRRDLHPRWSPDGTRLLFLSERERKGPVQLYAMPAGGGEATRLTDLRRAVQSPVWSPDGTRIAFVSRVGGPDEPAGEEERERSRPVRIIDVLKYKANGEGFVHDRPRHLFVVAADGGPGGGAASRTGGATGSAAPRQLTDGDFDDRQPAWAPDGRALAFVSARHAERDLDSAADVWLVPAEGGAPRRVTRTEGPVSCPAFSPDGRAIAYLGHPYRREVSRHVRVYTVSVDAEPVDGSPPVDLSGTLDRNCEPTAGAQPPVWLGATGWVAFLVEDRGDVSLYRARPGAVEPVVQGTRQLTGVSASRDGGLLAFAASDPVTPAELFVCGRDGSAPRRLTDLNREWRAEVRLARPEPFRFVRAGFEIDCWVMRPPDLAPGQRVPALLNIHGGPAAQYGHGFFDEFQVYAGAGYAVVYVNPRGSRGSGEAFARAVVGDWGGGDYADVMAGMDEALRRCDAIDPERLGVMGGSYGGFLTSWIVGHTDRFKAACSERAVNNQLSMVGTSDIGHYFVEAHAGGPSPWEDPGAHLARSPLAHARHIRTPLLILHSEDDLRCPVEQAEQLFVALKRLGRVVRLVRFPGEDHELSRSGRPRHRLERFRLLLEWFRSYLGPAGPGDRPESGEPAAPAPAPGPR